MKPFYPIVPRDILSNSLTVNRTVTGSSPVAGAKVETLTRVGFSRSCGNGCGSVRNGHSLRFSDKLAEPSRKNQKKAPRHADKASSGRSVGCSAAFSVRPLAYRMGGGERGGNRRERGPRTGVSRVSEDSCHPTVRRRWRHTHGCASDRQGYVDSLLETWERMRKAAPGRKRPERL